MLGAERCELQIVTPRITVSFDSLLLCFCVDENQLLHRDARNPNTAKTMIHASVQTGCMWRHNYGLQSNLQQLVCLSSLVVQVPPSLYIWVEEVREPCVQRGVESLTYGTAPRVLGVDWGKQIGQMFLHISAVAHGKVAEVPSVRVLWFENLSCFVALSS